MNTATETTTTYTPTIGIEVHAELKTKSKMFCGCMNDPHASKPNTNICPICLAHPGTLPMVNKCAVEKLITVGHAVKGEIASFTEFDRKNYFYPDIPKAYQISQYAFPFVRGGELAGVKLTRIHLEEDTARSLHDQGSGSVVDFNRAGVPLMELVTEPVIHDAKTAVMFGKELQLLLRSLHISDAHMEKGEMRVEANISVSKSDELGVKVEVKNLNSFKAMEQAIKYEVSRQITAIEKGETIIQETRGWNENRERTFSQRSKETAEDYRYFPDPDIPKFDISKLEEFDNSRFAEILQNTPEKKRIFYSEILDSRDLAELIISNVPADVFFKKVVAELTDVPDAIPLTANYLTSDIFALMDEHPDAKLENAAAAQFAPLMRLLQNKQINSRVAKDLLYEVVFEAKDPQVLIDKRGLAQMTSADDLMPIVDKIISEQEKAVTEYKNGKEASLQFLLGQGMKETRGSADPALLQELLKERLS